MNRILKWFFPIVTIGVAIFIVLFLISINNSSKKIDSEKLSLFNYSLAKEPKKNWINNFSKTQKLGYVYPVNEVYLEINLNEKIINTIRYELSASILDPYQLFCLKEELKNHQLKYYLKKEKRDVELLIYSKDRKKLDSLVKILKSYKIVAKIKPKKVG
jgi:hypothetical protein